MTTPPRSNRHTLNAFVAVAGTSTVLVRARDVDDARWRVAERLGIPGCADDITARPATADDLHLLDEITTGASRDRDAWADDVRALIKAKKETIPT